MASIDKKPRKLAGKSHHRGATICQKQASPWGRIRFWALRLGVGKGGLRSSQLLLHRFAGKSSRRENLAITEDSAAAPPYFQPATKAPGAPSFAALAKGGESPGAPRSFAAFCEGWDVN